MEVRQLLANVEAHLREQTGTSEVKELHISPQVLPKIFVKPAAAQ
jgi:hypothetical protein